MGKIENISTGKPKVGGAIFVAPKDTTLPTDATTTLDPAFKSVGYASEDGVENDNSPSGGTVKAWGGDTVLTYQDNREDSFTFKMLETMNENVLKIVYGDENVKGNLESGMTITVNNNELEEKAWVIEMILKGGILKRIVIPCAAVTSIGKVAYKDNEATVYEVTLTANNDEKGNSHYEYLYQKNEE